MPRPSLKNQRTKEILDAFERCIIESGIANTSLEQIADEAQMKRSILRHYIGNKEDLVIALGERWYRQTAEEWAVFIETLEGKKNRVEKVLNNLFTIWGPEYQQSLAVGEALFSEAKRQPSLKALLTEWLDSFAESLAYELLLEYPSASKKDCVTVGHGLIGIYLMSESLAPLGMPGRYHSNLKQSARRLVRSLG